MYDQATEREHAKIRVLMKVSRIFRPLVQPEDEELGERDLISVLYARYYRASREGKSPGDDA
jgi:hypothetical protein